ncbi:hypothetical protein Tco_0696077 [Tanacetum coccineum]
MDALLTAEIRETDDFKECKTVFMKVNVPMNQSQPVKRKQIAGESSSPQKSLKITIKQKKIVEKDDDDSEDRIELESHKDNPEVVNDDDDKEREQKDDEMGSLEIRNEEMQTTIPTPLSSPRKILSSNKKTFQELTDIVSNPDTSTSKHSQVKKRISRIYSHLPRALRRMCRRQCYMIQDMERKCVTIAKLWETHNKIDDILHEVRKEFKTFNEDARLSIQNWKDSWHKRVYKQNQKKVRINPEDYYSNHRITKVVRIVTDQPHGLDFMEEILVMRANDKPNSFSEADFKYLSKNNIEDLYYLYQSKEIDNQKVKLMNSLITFIRSCMIWERVYDFQLGIESYQMKVNLTAPTLTFPGIEERALCTIVDEPRMGLIYLNSKDEKRVMYLEEIVILHWKRF